MLNVKTFAPLANRLLLSKSVEDKISEAIRQKTFAPGQRLSSELELCEQFGVSRTVVREALRGLLAKGLITVRKGKGIFVSELTGSAAADPLHFYLQMNFEQRYVMDIVRARQILEPEIAALAAANRTDQDIARLEQDVADLECCADNYAELARLDTLFHIDIAKASGNSLMPLLLDPIHRLIPDIKSSVYATVADAKTSALTWHRRVLQDISSGHEKEARQSMVEHLKIAEQHSVTMLRARSTSDVKQ